MITIPGDFYLVFFSKWDIGNAMTLSECIVPQNDFSIPVLSLTVSLIENLRGKFMDVEVNYKHFKPVVKAIV